MKARHAAALIVVATALAYSNSFAGAFVFDDHVIIVENERIRDLWPPWPYAADTLRPLLFFTLAVNYALSGVQPWSYHAFNLLVHVAAALLLFDVVRRTLLLPRWHERHAAAATPMAFAIALLWAVHPLQTQSVTYIVQRGEVMAATLALLSLRCVIGELGARERRRVIAWRAGAIAALTLALTAKETAIAVIPLLLVYDRAVVSGSWREVMRRRWPLHAAVVGLPAAVALLRWLAGMPLLFSYNVEWAPLTYLLNQGAIILHYLRLVFWPHPLVFDYGWQPLAPIAALSGAAAVGLLLVAAGRLLRSRPAIGFAGFAFFILLAPTSSIMPIEDMAVEHRMYLPLAAVIAVAVAAAREALILAPRAALRHAIAAAALIGVAATFGTMTWARNRDYARELMLWEDTLAKRPGNARAFYNAGVLLLVDQRVADAAARFEQAIAIDPEYAEAYANLAATFMLRGDPLRAERLYREALRFDRALPEPYVGLGRLLTAAGRNREAAPYYEAAVGVAPPSSELLLELGRARLRLGDFGAAEAAFARALQLRPDDAAAQIDLAVLLAQVGRVDEAARRYRDALRVDPGRADAHHNLGLLQAQAGDTEGAIASYRRALTLRPQYAEAYFNLGTALAGLARYDEAVTACRRALLLRPDYAEAHNNLGAILLHLNRPHEAAFHLEKALAIRPQYEAARRNLTRAVMGAVATFHNPLAP